MGDEADNWMNGGSILDAGKIRLVNNEEALSGDNNLRSIFVVSDNLYFTNGYGEVLQITDGTRLNAGVVPFSFPIGCIMLFAGTSAPDGWYLCDGSPVSRTLDAALFAVISTIYGDGDGTTTFNVPNLNGRVPMGCGLGPNLTERRVLGARLGQEKHQITKEQLPAHHHEADTTTGLSKFYRTVGALYDGSTGASSLPNHQAGWPGGGQPQMDRDDTSYSNSDHRHHFVTNDVGENAAFDILPPSLVVNFIIRSK